MESTGKLTLQIMKSARWYNNWLFSFLKDDCKGDILEVGAGIGNFTDLLLNCGKVTAIDYERSYLKLLKNKYGQKVSVGFGDIEKGRYFFKNQKFDTIICLNVLEHIKNDGKALSNMFSLLDKKGKLILLVPAHMILFSKFDENLGHFRRYTKKQLNDAVKSQGFRNIKSRYINWLAAIGWFFFLKLTKINLLPDREVKYFNFFGRILLWPEKYVNFPFGLSVLAIAKRDS